MRIAVFTDSYKPQINGLITSMGMFNREIRKAGNSVFIFAPHVDKHEEKDRFVYRVKSVEFSSYNEYKIGLPFNIFVNEKLTRKKFDLVHVQSPFTMGIAGIAYAKRNNIPVVGSFHTLFSEYLHYFVRSEKIQKNKTIMKGIRKFLWHYLVWFYNKCDAVIAPSETIKNILIGKGVTKHIIVIPTGIKLTRRKKRKLLYRKRHGFRTKDKIIIHVGRVTKEKNIDFLVNEFSRMHKKDENVKMIITSDGPHKESLEEMVEKKGMKESVFFTGYVSKKELEEYYALADVFVMASKTETQGLVLNEAVLSRIPVVVVDAPVISDFVNENNIGVVSNRKNFRRNVTRLLNNKDLRENYMKNADKTLEKYDIRKCAGLLMELYAELINH